MSSANQRFGAAVSQDLAEPEIEAVEPIAVYRTGLDDVEELNGSGTGEAPPESNTRLAGQQKRLPVRLWLVTLGKLLPGYGRLWNVPLNSTSIFGMVYDASPL